MFIILQARQLVTSKIDRALQANGFQISFQGFPAVVRRSTHGPATTLDVTWREYVSGKVLTTV